MCIYSVPGVLIIADSTVTDQLITSSIGKAHEKAPVTKSTICPVYATYP